MHTHTHTHTHTHMRTRTDTRARTYTHTHTQKNTHSIAPKQHAKLAHTYSSSSSSSRKGWHHASPGLQKPLYGGWLVKVFPPKKQQPPPLEIFIIGVVVVSTCTYGNIDNIEKIMDRVTVILGRPGMKVWHFPKQDCDIVMRHFSRLYYKKILNIIIQRMW